MARRILFESLSAFAVLIVVCAALTLVDWSWSSWHPATCMPDSCFCEAIRTGSVAQPANSWSSLGFALVGLLVLSRARHDVKDSSRKPNRMTENLGYAAVFAVAAILMGVGSFFYHASLSFAGQFVDVLGMYLFAVFFVLYGLARRHSIGAGAFVAVYAVGNALLAYSLIAFPEYRRWLFGALLLAGLAIEISLRRRSTGTIDSRFLIAGAAAMMLAFTLWILDLTHVLCAPESLLQGHAAWHLLDAMAVGCLYLYYRSETDRRFGAT